MKREKEIPIWGTSKRATVLISLGLMILLFMVGLSSATTFQQHVQSNLTASCLGFTCSSLNVTILFPNSTTFINNQAMTSNTFYATYIFTPPVSGTYLTYFYDGGNYSSSSFDVNRIGTDLSTSKAIIYIGLLAILIFLFIVNGLAITFLPSSNNSDDKGKILSINNLKYFRTILYGVGYLLVLVIVFVSSNISFAFLGENMFGKLFFVIYQIMFRAMPIILIIMVIWLFAKIAHDKEIKNMVERGVPVWNKT